MKLNQKNLSVYQNNRLLIVHIMEEIKAAMEEIYHQLINIPLNMELKVKLAILIKVLMENANTIKPMLFSLQLVLLKFLKTIVIN